jgi:heme exporter protein A
VVRPVRAAIGGIAGRHGVAENMTFEIETRNLTKDFGHRQALRGVDLELPAGQFLTIIGPNGAGKSTLLRCIAGLSKPTRGQVLLGGQPLDANATEVRRRIGLVSHQTLLYDDLTAVENLRFYGRMYDVERLDSRIDELLRRLGLIGRAHDPVRTYSRGMQQRLAIARALMHRPSVLLLDEPYTGLDEQATEQLHGMLRRMESGDQTLIMTTHNLNTVVQVGSRVAILVDGRLAYDAPKRPFSLEGLSALYREVIGAGS